MAIPHLSQVSISTPAGTPPLVVTSSDLVSNLNAQYLNGQLGGYYQNAGNLNAGTLLAARLPAFTGDVSSTVGTVGLTLASVGTAGTYRSVTTDAKGRVTAGTNPTTLAGYGITDAMSVYGQSHDSISADSLGTSTSTGGIYTIASASAGSFTGFNDALFHMPYSITAWAHQIALAWNTPRMGFRTKNNGTWTSWSEVLHSDNYTSYALPLAGGTLTGELVVNYAAGRQRIIDGANALILGHWDTVNVRIEAAGRPLYMVSYGGAVSIGRSSGSNLVVDTASVSYGGNVILHAGNYTSYPDATKLPLTGGTLTGALNGTSAGFSSTVAATGQISANGGLSISGRLYQGVYTRREIVLPGPGTANFGNWKQFIRLWAATGAGANLFTLKISVRGTWNYSAVFGTVEAVYALYLPADSTISTRDFRIVHVSGPATDTLRLGDAVIENGFVSIPVWCTNSNELYAVVEQWNGSQILGTVTTAVSEALPAFIAPNFRGGLTSDGNTVLHAATTSAPSLSVGGSSARWATGRTISLTGDVTGTSAAFDGTAALSFAATLANSGATAGTYTKVTVNAKGLVTAGAALASADLPTYTGTITSGQVTTGLGYTPYNASNPNNYITASASITGNAATATNGFSVKPDWAFAANLISDLSNFNNSVPSGFYQYSSATNSPGTSWYNLINVRHSNTGNDHGFQLAMSYYADILWSRSYQGGTGVNNGTFTTWRAHLHSGNFNSYALPLAGGTLTGRLTASYTDGTSGWGSIQIDAAPTSGAAYIRANRATAGTGEVGYAWATGGVNKWINYLNVNSDTLGWYQGSASVMTLTTGGALTAASFSGLGTGLTGTAAGLSIGGTAATATNVAWSGITSKPTTLAGYALTDVAYGQAAYQSKSLDTVSTPGLYQYDGAFGGTKPPDNGANYRTVEIGSGSRFSQIAMPWNSENIYFRRITDSTYSAWRTVIHDGNYTAYPDATKLPLSGGSMTGYIIGAVSGGWNTYNSGSFTAYGNLTNPAIICFHRPGYFSTNLGLDTDGVIKIGGWSLGGPWPILHSNNFNSYALPLAGGTLTGALNGTTAAFTGTGTFVGSVGIGTTGPSAKLHVYNGSSHFEATSNGNAAITAGVYALVIGPLSNRDATAGRYYGGVAFNHLLNYNGNSAYNGAPQAWIGTRLQDTAGSERDYLVFATKPGTGTSGTGSDIPQERMCIDRDGLVGIGTLTPAYKLDVNGTGRFSNTLQATRLNFGDDNATPWLVGAGGTAGTGLTFGGDYTSEQAYKIFTAMENVGGNYSKLTLNWHTGIRIGAHYSYGGTRFYNNFAGSGTEIFSVGNGDSNVRVVNTLYIGGNTALHTANYNSYALPLTGGAITGAVSIIGQTVNGQTHYQWSGASFQNAGDWTASLIVRKDNATVGINGHIPSLVLYNNNGGDQTTVGLSFASAEGATGQGNAVPLAGIVARKEGAGTVGNWSSGSLNIYVKNGSARVDALNISSTGTANFPIGLQQGGNQVLHAGNVATYAFAKSGTWAADLVSSYGYTRETGMQMSGGSEFVVLSKSGQGYLLVDGSYIAAEAGGFYSTNNSSGGTLLGFTADTTTSLNFNTTAVKLNGNQVLHAANYSAYALPLTGGTITGNTTFSANNYLTFGPNSSWSRSLRIGGDGYTAPATTTASVVTTNGNLHLDAAKAANAIYLNWYGGTGGTIFGNGSGTQVGAVDGSGNASFIGAITQNGSQVLHAGNYISSYIAKETSYTTPINASGYSWVRIPYAVGHSFNDGQSPIEFYVTRSIFANGSTPYGGCTAKFVIQSMEWHNGQQMATVQYGERGDGASFGAANWITHAKVANLSGGGYWVYLRLRTGTAAGITYYIRRAAVGGQGLDPAQFENTTDPGGAAALYYGFNLISAGTEARFYRDGNVVLDAGNYTSYPDATKLPLAGGTLTGALNGTTGSFSGNLKGGRVTLRDDCLEQHVDDSDGVGIFVNYVGYNSGTTRFRNFGVFNGKNQQLLYITGSTGATAITGTLAVSSAITQGGNQVLHAGNYGGYSTFSGIVSSASGGFQTATYVAGRNRIWTFGNADGYGINYYQGSGGISGNDVIGFNFGNATAALAQFQFLASGSLNATGTITATNFSGPGTSLTGTASSLVAGSANAIADGVVSTSAKIAASVVTYAKIQNVTAYTVLGNSNASGVQAPVEISMATLAGMVGSQYTTNIANSYPDRVFMSTDANIKYAPLATAKAHLGLSSKYNNSRPAHTGDTNYWVGSMGWGTTDWNAVFDYGSGFTDSWSSPANNPGDTSHHVGVQALHYTNGSGRYGWQMVNGAATGRWWLRDVWGGGFSSWKEMIHSGNIASQTVAVAGSCTGSAGSVAWTNVSGRPTAVSSFSNDSGYITSGGSISGSSGSCSGNAASVTDGVYLSNNQSIGGVKTFSSAPIATNIAKAWVHYNKSTTTITASYNVSSVTSNGTGVFTVNFTNAMVDTNYVVAGTATYGYDDQDIYGMALVVPRRSTAQQAGSCRLATEFLHAAQIYDCVAVRAVFYR